MRAGLWAVICLGFITGLLALLRPTAAPTVRRSPTATATPTADVGGFAQLYVSTFVETGSGTESELRRFYSGTVDFSAVQPRAMYVSRSAVVRVEASAAHYWLVTVAAEVLADRSGSYQPAGTRYFEVGVYQSSTGLTATGLPAAVAAPPTGKLPPLASTSMTPPDSTDPVATAAAQFFEALLTGSSDVSRFVAPEATVRPVTPAPFAKVTLTAGAETGTGQNRTVVATVQGTTAAGSVEVLQYQLRMHERAGRWEVTAMSGAPDLAPPDRSRSDGTSSTTAATPAPETAPAATAPGSTAATP